MIKGYITNLSAYVSGSLRGEWLEFPATEADIKNALERIGNPEEVFFTGWECDEVPEISRYLGEYEQIESINELAGDMDEMDGAELLTLAAVLESGLEYARDAADLLELCEEVQDGAYTLIEGVDNVEDLGYYYATETGAIDELPDWARGYFDYEAYGRDISIEVNGEFVGAGWIEKTA